MTPCTVCGRPGEPLKAVRMALGERLEWMPTASPGAACSPECAALIFVRPSKETPDERRLTAWAWKKRRAEARGEPFNEPAPLDETERKWLVWCSLHRDIVDVVAQGEKEAA